MLVTLTPTVQVTKMDWYHALARWQELQPAIKALQEEERALREMLFHGTFPDPKEGVNSVTLPDGRTLKGTYKISRTVDQSKVAEVKVDLNTFNAVFRQKYDLVLAAYRNVLDKDRKQIDKALTIKPSLPTLEIVEAKVEVPYISPAVDGY